MFVFFGSNAGAKKLKNQIKYLVAMKESVKFETYDKLDARRLWPKLLLNFLQKNIKISDGSNDGCMMALGDIVLSNDVVEDPIRVHCK